MDGILDLDSRSAATALRPTDKDIASQASRSNESESDTSFMKHFVDESTGEKVVQRFFAKPVHGMDAFVGGNCWCTASPDNFCSCTPSMAIDVVLASGNDHVWLIQRKDTGKFATMGGFVEVGETAEEAVARELYEETQLSLTTPPRLFGVYSDPRRDVGRHRHSVSIVYIVDIPLGSKPDAGDDAQQVVRISLDQVDDMDFFIDHKSIFVDYKEWLSSQPQQLQSAPARSSNESAVPQPTNENFAAPFKRSLCHEPNGYMPQRVDA